MSYWLIFLSAFGAATIIPFSSEVAVVVAIKAGYAPELVWLSASVGNTLGAAVNWVLGRYLLRFSERAWFPFSKDQLDRGQQWFDRYGVWSLLFAWLPIVGDALTIIAGVFRVPLWQFLILVAVGKSLRYWVVILASMNAL